MALPKIAIVSTGGTIQNSQPFVTSSKAGGSLNVLRPQRLHEPVTIRIAKEDVDGIPIPATGDEDAFWTVTLEPNDGLYLLPYMDPGHQAPEVYTGVRISGPRLVEEINRFGLDTYGTNNLIGNLAELVFLHPKDRNTGAELRAGGETFATQELLMIADAVQGALADDEITGCVVTHGTFTTEETACFLNYVVDSNKPLVVAASQRRHTSIGNDGDWNLVDAVRVAVCPEAAGKGVMVIMNEGIYPAREVIKTNQRPDGFTSTGGSALSLGSVEADQVSFYFQPTRKNTTRSEVRPGFPLPTTLPKVDIVKTYGGADEVPIRALVKQALEDRADPSQPSKHGIVVEGFAYSGVPHRFQRSALQEAVNRYGIPVGLTNRGARGRIPHHAEPPFLTCDNLTSVKARLLMMLAIEKLGMLTPASDPSNPTPAEQERLQQELGRFQEIFDTH